MEKEFLPHDLALELKKLGFDEPCFGFYDDISKDFYQSYTHTLSNNNIKNITKAPLYQQAFRFLRELYDLRASFPSVNPIYFEYVIATSNSLFKNSAFDIKERFIRQEEAEFACLKKLIDLVKEKCQ